VWLGVSRRNMDSRILFSGHELVYTSRLRRLALVSSVGRGEGLLTPRCLTCHGRPGGRIMQ